MNKKSIISFIIIVAIVLGIACVGLFGLKVGNKEFVKAKDAISLGLDLQGGVYVLLEAQTDANGNELTRIMEQSKAVIQQRVDGLGLSEPNIAIEGGNRIRVELAGVKDAEEAMELIGKTAQLAFVDPEGNTVLTGKNVVESMVQYTDDPVKGQVPVVSLEFDKEGSDLFYEATQRLSQETEPQKKLLFIVLDNEVISSPIVQTPISGGKAQISGENMSIDEAAKLATLIKAGALPVPLTELTSSVIGPTLGLDAYEKSILAIGISLVAIMIIMLILYKVLSVPAIIGLTVYTEILVIFYLLLDVKLTLPGIAGLILSIGMAVDTNVVIFERIREELKNGKTPEAAINAGHHRALSSVIDSNVTTFIAGLVLYKFGVASIKGFGITLMLGIVASMVTGVLLSRLILKLMTGFIKTKNPKVWGA
ncbi:protein translocase subunit SecD [uncultured Ezakiella sp.]|uniref:protein translocase subunit SecD n=1 Tax=uncultured Ezakiella sp. TaxID=1637529 RepID=UPI0025D08651|nr:protein translocase subunit SecD [uncultured Ezakiella sp.]